RYHYYTCPSSCCPLASFFLSLFFTLRRPPYPSLFPYTTLFRSLPLALAPKLQQRARTSGAARSRPAGAGPAVAARAPALRVAHALEPIAFAHALEPIAFAHALRVLLPLCATGFAPALRSALRVLLPPMRYGFCSRSALRVLLPLNAPGFVSTLRAMPGPQC